MDLIIKKREEDIKPLNETVYLVSEKNLKLEEIKGNIMKYNFTFIYKLFCSLVIHCLS